MGIFNNIVFDEFTVLEESVFAKKTSEDEFNKIHSDFMKIVNKIESKIKSTKETELILMAIPELMDIAEKTEKAKKYFNKGETITLKYFLDMNFIGEAKGNINKQNNTFKEFTDILEKEGFNVSQYSADNKYIKIYFIRNKGSDIGFVFESKNKFKKK